MRSSWICVAISVAVTANAQAPAGADHSTAKLGNPFTSSADRQSGGLIYRSQCASCHGVDGKGGAAGPDLSRGQFKHATSDEAMFRVIAKGLPGTVMPATSLDGRAIWQLVTHIRGLNDDRMSPGEVEKGAALFAQHRCGGCHARNAPDLSQASARLTLAEIRQAITDPGAQVAPEQWRWRAKRADGAVIEGLRLNEDTFSVQIISGDGKLQTYERAALKDAEYDKRSAMPSFKDKLSAQDLEHLTAYLRSLRGAK